MKIPLWEIVAGAAIFIAAKCLKRSKEDVDLLRSANGAFDMLYGMYTSESLMAELYEDMNALGYLLTSSYTVTINEKEDIYYMY